VKLGPLEGTPDEVRDFFKNNGLNVTDFFEIPDAPIRKRWFVVTSVGFIITVAILVLSPSLSPAQQKFCFVVACSFAIWLAVVVQLRFKSVWATGIVVVGTLLLALVSLGVVTPTQMLDEIKTFKKE
jgi:hypothetical protein